MIASFSFVTLFLSQYEIPLVSDYPGGYSINISKNDAAICSFSGMRAIAEII